MSKTNDQLARLAAERLANENQLRGTEAFAAKVIADVYADAMLEREQNDGCRKLFEALQQACREFIDNNICAETRDVQIDNLLGVYIKQAARIRELESSLTRWIPCSERMPEYFETVMFVMSRRSHSHVCCGHRDTRDLWLDYIEQDELTDACVDCWRELPTLPQPPEATT